MYYPPYTRTDGGNAPIRSKSAGRDAVEQASKVDDQEALKTGVVQRKPLHMCPTSLIDLDDSYGF